MTQGIEKLHKASLSKNEAKKSWYINLLSLIYLLTLTPFQKAT